MKAEHSDPEVGVGLSQTRVNPKHRLPEGLPACIAAGRSGLKVLQDLFGLANRRAWQSILHSETVKHHIEGQNLRLRGLTTSQKLARRILAFYGNPNARFEGWDLYCALGLDLPDHDSDLVVPSLEYSALKRYPMFNMAFC